MAAGGGGRSYRRRPERGWTQAAPERLETRAAAQGSGRRGGAAGVRGGWTSRAPSPQAGRSPGEGAEGGEGCAEAWAALRWAAEGGFGGGGGACAAGGGSGGYRGGDTSESDLLWADGEDGISFVHPSGELYLQPLAESQRAMLRWRSEGTPIAVTALSKTASGRQSSGGLNAYAQRAWS